MYNVHAAIASDGTIVQMFLVASVENSGLKKTHSTFVLIVPCGDSQTLDNTYTLSLTHSLSQAFMQACMHSIPSSLTLSLPSSLPLTL